MCIYSFTFMKALYLTSIFYYYYFLHFVFSGDFMIRHYVYAV